VRLPREEEASLGSNNWAVSGARSRTGSAIVANDMHLRLAVPNIWYRATYVLPDERRPGQTRTLSGVTLPGGPQMAVGTNGDIAWGFTNSAGDWSDLVIIEPVPGDPTKYQTPDGPRAFDIAHEPIVVKGAAPVDFEVRSTIWGPIVARDHQDRELASRWWRTTPRCSPPIRRASPTRVGGRGAAGGRRRLAGRAEPRRATRAGASHGRSTALFPAGWASRGDVPTSWADGTHRWDGYLGYDEHPRVVDPPDGRLWTANARTVDGAMLDAIGDGGYNRRIRAWMIRDRLRRSTRRRTRPLRHAARRPVTLPRPLARRVPENARRAGRPARRCAEAARLRAISGADAPPPIPPPIVSCARSAHRVADGDGGADGAGATSAPASTTTIRRLEGRSGGRARTSAAPARQDLCVVGRFCSPPSIARCSRSRHRRSGRAHVAKPTPPTSRIARERRAAARPLAQHAAQPLTGDVYTRVWCRRGRCVGRFVASPGHEASAILHMPGGQSGHPLSPHYGDQQRAWVTGTPLPLLPGAALHTLTLTP
jgi:penicillin amidase